MLKKFLCTTLAGVILLLTASCTPIDISEESSLGAVSGTVNNSTAVSENESESGDESASSDVAVSEEESSEEISVDTELKIPTVITSDAVDSFFDGGIFVGNSIMLKYEKFVSNNRASSTSDFLGNAKFFCAGSFGVYHNNHTPASKDDAVNPKYQGTKYSVQDMVGVANPKRVFINLAGLNDMGIFPVSSCAEDTAKEMNKIIDDIKTKYPEVEIVVLSTTYMVKRNNNMSRLNNENLSIMNNLILDYCNANGIDFVDISTLLTENGCLADKYCSDLDSLGCHLNDSGCLVWTGLLRNYAAKKIAGIYKNPESMPMLSKG